MSAYSELYVSIAARKWEEYQSKSKSKKFRKSKEFGYDTNETEEYSQVKHTFILMSTPIII